MAKRAYRMAAGDDQILFNALSIAGDLSISVWIGMDDVSNGVTGQIFGDNTNNEYFPRFSLGANDAMFQRIATFSVIQPLPSGQVETDWEHWLFVRTGTTYNIYRSLTPATALVLEGQTLGGSTVAWTPNRIGSDPTGVNSLATRLFDVRVWSKALSAGERDTVHAFGEVNDSLELWYKCIDQHPTIATDSSPNANHGTKANITLPDFHYEGADIPFDFDTGTGQPSTGMGLINGPEHGMWQR